MCFSSLPTDALREIRDWLPTNRDIVTLTLVSMSIRGRLIPIGEVQNAHKVIDMIRQIITDSCPTYVPGSTFVIAGSFAAYLAAIQLGVSKGRVNMVFNDVDVFFRFHQPPVFDEVYHSIEQEQDYPHATYETITVDDRLYEVNWVPACYSVTPEARSIVSGFDLNCVRAAYEIDPSSLTIRTVYFCPKFCDFLKSENPVIQIVQLRNNPHDVRSTAIRMFYKSMMLKASCDYSGVEKVISMNPRTYTKGSISQSSAAKIKELKSRNFAIPSWFDGLLLEHEKSV